MRGSLERSDFVPVQADHLHHRIQYAFARVIDQNARHLYHIQGDLT